MWRASKLDEPARIRFENIIDMGLTFSTMMRLFRKGSKGILYDQIVTKTAEEIFNTNSRDDFVDVHSRFCDWGVRKIFLAEKKRNGQLIKKSTLASYGQIAKTFDVTLKVAVYYSHLPNCEKSMKISEWLNAAVDTQMMSFLREQYPSAIRSWPAKIEEVQKSDYLTIQEIVRKFIKEERHGDILPVQFDDIYWSMLNQ